MSALAVAAGTITATDTFFLLAPGGGATVEGWFLDGSFWLTSKQGTVGWGVCPGALKSFCVSCSGVLESW